jgi:hypothetical protein
MEAYNLLVNYQNHVTVNKRYLNQSGLDQVAYVTDGKKQKTEDAKPLDKDFLKTSNVLDAASTDITRVIVLERM